MSAITSAEMLQQSTTAPLFSFAPPQPISFFDGREIGMTGTVVSLTPEHCHEIGRLASMAMRNFGLDEPTDVARRHGVPTLLARVDCTITPDGIGLFECDERPAGVGITEHVMRHAAGQSIRSKLTAHFSRYAGGLPRVVRHPRARPNDDGAIFEVSELGTADHEGPILVRAEPDDIRDHEQLAALQARAVSTVITKGDKRYLTLIPEANTRVASSADVLQPERSFVLKPVQGSKSRGVAIYLSAADRQTHGRQGTVTFERARRELAAAAAGTMLLQEFMPPIPTAMPDGSIGNTILRVFTLVHPGGRCEAIGGTFLARRELLVHGASNAICGAVVV